MSRPTPFQVRIEMEVLTRGSAEKLAQLTGVSAQMISAYRRGESLPGGAKADQFMRLFNMEADAWDQMLGASIRVQAQNETERAIELKRAVRAERETPSGLSGSRPSRSDAAGRRASSRTRRGKPTIRSIVAGAGLGLAAVTTSAAAGSSPATDNGRMADNSQPDSRDSVNTVNKRRRGISRTVGRYMEKAA